MSEGAPVSAGCPHGRASWASCPHCLGINSQPPASDGQKPIITVRFPPSLAAQARRVAGQDGAALGAWIRRLVEREIGQQEGKCPACGQEVKP